MAYTFAPIGAVRSTRTESYDDNWDAETTVIELDPERFGPEALLGLDDFSHVEGTTLRAGSAATRAGRSCCAGPAGTRSSRTLPSCSPRWCPRRRFDRTAAEGAVVRTVLGAGLGYAFFSWAFKVPMRD